MKRLTQMTNSVVVYIGAHNEEDGGQIPCEVSPQGVREILVRLAAYEDTELTPEEVTAMQHTLDEYHKVADPLLRAQVDGRLVVLPCKVGEKLWVTGRDNVPREMELEAPDIRTVCTDEDNLCMSTCNRKPDGFCAYRLRNDGTDIGKTVFLTREDAEKALEAMKDD